MKIKLNSIKQEVVIEKLPIKKYVDMLDVIEHLPEQLNKLEGIEDKAMLSVLPKLISAAFPDFVKILEIATSLEKDQIENLYLEEFVNIIFELIKENNLIEMVGNVKKNLAQIKEKN